MLPVTLMRVYMPKTGLSLSPLKMLCGKPFPSSDITVYKRLLDSYNISSIWATYNRPLTYMRRVLPVPGQGEPPGVCSGDQILLKTWRERTLADQLNSKLKGPISVIPASPISVKGAKIDNCIHLSGLKVVPSELSEENNPKGILRFLFNK